MKKKVKPEDRAALRTQLTLLRHYQQVAQQMQAQIEQFFTVKYNIDMRRESWNLDEDTMTLERVAGAPTTCDEG